MMFSIFSKFPVIHVTSDKANNHYYFPLRNSSFMGEIELIRNPLDIDQNEARNILVKSFMGEYQKYLSPGEISDELTSWHDGDFSVQKYYENYFRHEFTGFSEGKLDYWVQAKVNGNLVGWATFVFDPHSNSVYMNTLVTHPAYQGKNIGKELVMSLINLKEIEDLSAIHLLLRKKNRGGRIFYSKLGFFTDPEYHREDNFVDMDLLESLTWKNPVIQATIAPVFHH